ncbi:MAG: cupin [Bdellovibrionota bacterium]
MSNSMAGVAHCTLKDGKISKAVCHKTVSEIWTIISGSGQIWRKQDDTESITNLEAGVTIDIAVGTYFQYCSNKNDLVFICVTTPPWPGADEIIYIDKGAWVPT